MSEKTAVHSPAAQRLLDEWEAIGVTQLPDVAERAAARRPALRAARRLPFHADTIYRDTPAELARTIVHPRSEYAVVIDGTETHELDAYAGRPLHFVLEPDAFADGRVFAFTSASAALERLTLLSDEEDGGIGSSHVDHLTDQCIFYEHHQWEGDVKSVGPGYWFADLTEVVRDVFWQDWNDVISSIDQSRSFRVAWEHVDGRGSSLSMVPGWGHGKLNDIGWNDRISSIANYG